MNGNWSCVIFSRVYDKGSGSAGRKTGEDGGLEVEYISAAEFFEQELSSFFPELPILWNFGCQVFAQQDWVVL